MILFRVFPWDTQADAHHHGGALWFAQPFQGAGRHDNPDVYGCLYASELPVGAVAEQLARFRGAGAVSAEDLEVAGLPLGLATLEVAEGLSLVDLDDPTVLVAERLRPSRVATSQRTATQADAARLFDGHAAAAGLRWWSTLEAAWPNVTLFDRAAPHLKLADVQPLTVRNEPVEQAAEMLGLALV